MIGIRRVFRRSAGAVLCGYALLTCVSQALAYRPFDGTDADIAPAGEAEIELGPVQRLREGSKTFLHAPALVANFGMANGRELVLEGRREVALDREPGEPRSALVDDGVFVKQLLREGTLQEASGPSVATEYGLFLPGIRAGHGAGLSVAAIASQRWPSATLHLNSALAKTREHESDLFLGAIVEGPFAWRVRPVAEIFRERASGGARIDSRLVGAIWRVREGLSLDAGLRYATAAGPPIHELRLGLTWAFPFNKPGKEVRQ